MFRRQSGRPDYMLRDFFVENHYTLRKGLTQGPQNLINMVKIHTSLSYGPYLYHMFTRHGHKYLTVLRFTLIKFQKRACPEYCKLKIAMSTLCKVTMYYKILFLVKYKFEPAERLDTQCTLIIVIFSWFILINGIHVAPN